jgi:uncharacterized membrane protein
MENPQLSYSPEENIVQNQQSLSLVSGAALTSFALFHRRLLSIPAFLVGMSLLYRWMTGKSLLDKFTNESRADEATSDNVSVPHEQGVHVVHAVTINRPIEDLYNFWHDFSNLPQVMTYVESIEPLGDNRTHWTLKLPGGKKVEYDAETYTNVPNEVISWRSLPDSEFQNAGSVRFRAAPADRGTEVKLTVEFMPPAGPIGQALLKLFGEIPAQYVGQYLREFKQMMETGEKATTKGQPSGRKQHQPLSRKQEAKS